MSVTIDQANSVISAEAWMLHQSIVTLRNAIEQNFLELGAALYEFKRKRLYRAFEHPTFESYLADPDVDVGRSMAYLAMQIHTVFVMELERPTVGLLEAGSSKLGLIAPHATPDNVEELEHMAASLSRSDLRDMLCQMFGDDATPPLPCDHRRWSILWHRLARKYYRKWRNENDRNRYNY